MQAWSDKVIPVDFRVRFFLDTNLLVYLVDKSYPTLNEFIGLLNEPFKPFVELVSSRYVVFEFVGVRKKENYQRTIIKTLAKTNEGVDTLIRTFQSFRDNDRYYLSDESLDEIKFDKVIPGVKSLVENELQTILYDFNINYDYGKFHIDQLEPTFEICLTSKLSNYDSLVLVSSVLPQNETRPPQVLFLTADANLVNFYDLSKVSAILSKHSVVSPAVHYAANLHIENCPTTNLQAIIDKDELTGVIKRILLTLMKERLSTTFLGVTVEAKNPRGTIPKDVIFIRLPKNYPLVDHVKLFHSGTTKKLYLTIVGQNLDFVYTAKKAVESFWYNNKKIESDTSLPLDDNSVIVSFSARDVDDDGNERAIDDDVLDAIRVNGNLVFIHPDSFL